MELDPNTLEYAQSNPSTILLISSLASMRPLGMTLSFIAFAWVLPQANIIRTGIAFGIAIPVMWNEWGTLLNFVINGTYFSISSTFIKELAIGYVIGLLISVPFWIIQFAGSLVDAYRGESSAGFADPLGGEIPTIGRLYLVIAYLVFFAGGGVWFLVEMVYDSYTLWPIVSEIPNMSGDMVKIVLGIFDAIFVMALVLAAPILFVLLAIDFIVLFSGKIAKGFSPMDLSFTVKNLLTIVMLPIMAMILIQYIEQSLFKNIEVMSVLKNVML